MDMSSAAGAEAALGEWKRRGEKVAADRDPLVLAAHTAGLNVHRIHKVSGISRTTIYKILDLDAGTGET
jgi:transcriptional regulator of acetoin/glycerol metabolism